MVDWLSLLCLRFNKDDFMILMAKQQSYHQHTKLVHLIKLYINDIKVVRYIIYLHKSLL